MFLVNAFDPNNKWLPTLKAFSTKREVLVYLIDELSQIGEEEIRFLVYEQNGTELELWAYFEETWAGVMGQWMKSELDELDGVEDEAKE